MSEILYLFVVAIVSVIFLFIIAKLLGKRQISQLDFVDYIIGISIGSISAEMATDINDKPMYYYLIAIGIFFLFDLIINFLGRKSPFLKHLLKGKPLMIIYDGQIIYKNLKKSKLSVNDVLCLARQKGYFDILDIKYAVFEDSGNLSIMPNGDNLPPTCKDLDVKKEASLPYYLVTDGVISFSTLDELNKDKSWLLSELNLKSDKELKNIILAEYDKDNNHINVHLKNQK